jgi:nucleotide-binding universal stress UspA family protein
MRPLVHRIVAGVATLRPDDPALVSAVRLAARLDAELYLVHVRNGGRASGVPAETGLDLKELAESADPAAAAGLRVICSIVDGRAEDRLRELTSQCDADLLVLGATRRGALAGAVLGTTAGHLLRSVHTPILVVRGSFPAAPVRVLLTTDLSHHAVYAHSRGAALATALCAPGAPELRSLFVDPPPLHDDWLTAPLEHPDPEDELRAFLEAEVPRTPTAPAVRSGDPASEIISAARDWQADLLVMGTHGRHGPLRLLLGSVAETVLRHAPCATLVIPPPQPGKIAADRARSTSAESAPVTEGAPLHTS